jgi:DNA end-binding protein Ku
MRTLWSGAISFGLINIPVKLVPATSAEHLDLDMLDSKDLAPIRFVRVNKHTGREVPYKEIVKGFEVRDGEYVVVEKEDFERASPRKTKAIELSEFVDFKEIDSRYFTKPYYLEPGKGAEKPYALLRDALANAKKVGIGRFVLRNRESLVALKPEGQALVLQQMRFDREIVEPETITVPKASPTRRELEMAEKLIEQLSGTFKPATYRDTYTEELKAIIEQKAQGKKARGRVPEVKPTKVGDLMSLLRKSLEDTDRAEAPSRARIHRARRRARKAA